MSYLVRETKNLVIRPLKLSDYTMWCEYYSTLLPYKNMWDRLNKSPKELSMQSFKQIIKSQKQLREQDRFYDLAIFEKKSSKYIGTIAIMDVLRGLAYSAYLGYVLHNRFWGMGYGKEATLAGIDIGFRDIKLHRLEAGIEPYNRRSIMMARSVGLRKEGLKKRAVFLRGKWQDLVMYSATCEEFGIKWKGNPKTRPR